MMDSDADFNRDFALLRPFCVDLLENPSLDAIERLKNVLSNFSERNSGRNYNYLQEYVCIPLFEIINGNNNRNENLIISAIDCIENSLSISQIDDVKFFNRILFNVLMTITGKPDPTLVKEFCSEELKLSVVKCINKLFSNITSSLCQLVYSSNFQGPLGHLVYILLRLSEDRTSRHVTAMSIECLCAVMQNHQKENEEILRQVGERFAAFLPGISIAMTKIIRDNTHRGQEITVKSLRTWALCVSIVLDDGRVKWSQERAKCIDSKEEKVGIAVDCNENWLQSTSEKLKLLSESISCLRIHGNHKVRLALVQWASVLLAYCPKSLCNCVPIFTQILIGLSYDEYGDVKAECEGQLKDLWGKGTIGGQGVVDLVEEDLRELVIKLPRIFRRMDDSETTCNIRLLRGYLDFLKERLKILLMSSSLLERLTTCLIDLTQLDFSDTAVVMENLQTLDLDSNFSNLHNLEYPKIQFKYFNIQKVYVEIVTVCRALGKYGDLQILADYFLDKLRNTNQHRHQCTFLLNEMILGAAEESTTSGDGSAQHFHYIGSVLEEYLTPTNWDAASFATKDRDWPLGWKEEEPLNGGKVRENVAHLCLLLEGVANCSKVLGVKFRPYLRKVLYPILEKIEDHSSAVSQSSYITLSTLRSSCGYRSAAEMLRDNSDVFFNRVFVKLRYVPESCAPLKVFRAALRVGGEQLVPNALVTVDDVLHSLDSLHTQQSEMYLRLLLSVLLAVEKLHASPVTYEENVTNEERADENELLAYLLEYHKLRQRADDLASDVISDVPCGDEADETCGDDEDPSCVAAEDMQEKSVPIYVETTVKILERCVHLMSSKDAHVRLVVLEVVDVGLRVLARHEDHLLPIVHQVWAPLTFRFADEKVFVIRKAFAVLCTMVKVCGEFLEGRFAKEVWPSLLRYLEKQAKFSCRVKMSAAKPPTTEFKLVTDILSNLGNITVKLRLSEMHCAQLILATFRYLSVTQQPYVQEAANILYKHLSGWVPDLLWLQLNAVCGSCSRLEAVNQNECENWRNTAKCEWCPNMRTLLDILNA